MWPMAVEVRPEACAVPISASCTVDRLAATAATCAVVRALTCSGGQSLHLGGGQTTHLRGGQGGDVLGRDGLQVWCRWRSARVVDTPVMPAVDSAAIWVVLMLLPRACTWAEVNTLRAWVLRLERFVVATAAMWPMAVEVRPEACAVPISASCAVDRLGGDHGDLRGGQGVDLQRRSAAAPGWCQTADLRGGQGGDVLGGDGLQIRGADGVQRRGDTPVMPAAENAAIWRGADVAAQGMDLGGGEHTQGLGAQAREVRGGYCGDVAMAVVVRPEACAVPISASCAVDSLPATAATCAVVRALTCSGSQQLHLGGGQTTDLGGGQGGDVLGRDGLQGRGADGVQCRRGHPVMPAAESATIWVVLRLLLRARTWTEVNTLRA